MAVLAAANIGGKITLGLRLRSISGPWVYRSKIAFCLNCKEDYSSSGPVRYIPKKTLKTKLPENSQPLKDLKKSRSLDSLDSSRLKDAACSSSSIPDKYEPKKHFGANELEDCRSSKDLRRSESCESLELNELKSGEFSPSVPVRSAPEKSLNANGSENVQPLMSLRKNEASDSLGSNELKGGNFSSSLPIRSAYEESFKANGSENSRALRNNESCDNLGSSELKGGNFSSSVPLRNAPEKSLEANGLENSQPLMSLRKNGPCESLDSNELKGEEDSSSLLPIMSAPEKSSKANDGSESSRPLKSLRKHESRNCLDLSALGIKVMNNGSSVGKHIALVESTRRQNRVYKKNISHGGAKQEEEVVDDLEIMGDETMEEPEDMVQEILINQHTDTCKANSLQAEKGMQDAEKYAVKLLASRAYTAVELRKKMQGKKFPPNVVEAVITKFQSRGLINDGLYAETYSQSRFSSSTWGPRRIKQGLYQKGISGRDADKAVRTVFEDDKSSNDSESNLGMSKLSMDHLLVRASKQWLRGQDVPKETRKSRIIRWLQYRGFSWGVIGLVLKKLESQYPP